MSRFGEALQQLESRKRSGCGVSLYSRLVNRPGGRLLAAGFSLTPATPNQVTLISGAMSLLGVILIAVLEPTWWLGVAVWFSLALGFMLDSADGQLARLTGGESEAGEWLDHLIDAMKVVLVNAAVLISWYRFWELPDDRLLLVPIASLFSAVALYFGGILAGLLLRSAEMGPDDCEPSVLRSAILLPVDYGVFCLVFLLLGSPVAFVAVFAFLAIVRLGLLPVMLVKWYRELSVGRGLNQVASS